MSLGGLAQQIAQTIMTFKVDTSQARAELKKLEGAEKAAAQASVDAIEKRNNAMEGMAKKITQVNAVVAGMNKVLELGGQAFQAYEENSRLTMAAANVSIGALRTSSQGLRTDLDLLKLAAAGNAATFKSSQQQLENAAAAMVAFERAGFESNKTTEKVREAILKGNIEPLKELGVVLDTAKTKQEQFAQLQDVLAKKAQEAGEGHAAAGESFKRAAVEYDNAMRDIKVALGELVAGLAPLLSALASAVGLIADVVQAAAGAVGSLHRGMSITDNLSTVLSNYMTPEMKALIASREAQQQAQRDQLAADFGGIDGSWQPAYGAQDKWNAIGRRGARLNRRGSGGGGYNFGGTDNQDYAAPGAQYIGSVEQRDTAGRPIGFSTDFGGGSFGGGLMGDPRGFEGGADALSRLAADLNHAGTQSLLQKTLGPISEFDAYATAIATLTGSLQAGFSAWIDGSMSAGAAIKKFFSESIKAMASEMFAKAIQHGAYAIGSLAFGDAKGAATHGLAAAKFAAGAIVVGGLARTLGGGTGPGAGASAGAGGSAPSVIGAGGGGPAGLNGGTRVYIVGDAWSSDGSRRKNRDVARAVRSADRFEADQSAVRFS